MITILGTDDVELLRSISEKRTVLFRMAERYGMTSNRTVLESRELDVLIAIYQRVQMDMLKKKRKRVQSRTYPLS